MLNANSILKTLQYISLLIALFISSAIIAVGDISPEIRKITPPKLDTHNFGKKIICYRPMRRTAPNMTLEIVSNKVVIHNYGHGGSGWTLGPGSAKYVNDLLLNSKSTVTIDAPITVIGAGALGLFTAYDLYIRGYKNITIVAEKFDALTSHNAGGLIAPVSMDNAPEMQKNIDKIGVDAYQFFKTIAIKKHPHFKDGATIIPSYWSSRADSGLEPYVGKVMRPAKDVVLDFGNGTTRNMVAYDDSIFVDTPRMLLNLTQYLKSQNIKFVHKKIKNFSEISDLYIMNCSGLGSTELNSDKELIAVQGHLIMLEHQNPEDLQYMILVYLDEGKTNSGQKIKRSFYMFPKKLLNSDIGNIGVIGGTFIEGTNEANEKEFDIIIKNAQKFYYGNAIARD